MFYSICIEINFSVGNIGLEGLTLLKQIKIPYNVNRMFLFYIGKLPNDNLKVKFGDPAIDLPPQKNYPILSAVTSDSKQIIVVIPFELLTKMNDLIKHGKDFVVTRFIGDAGERFRIFICFSMEEINENFILDITEDTTIIPTLLQTHSIIFISDHRFKLGETYPETLNRTDISGAIPDLEQLYELKKTANFIKPENRPVEIRVIYCTHCTCRFLFSALKKSCFSCGKENLNYNDDGDFILSS